MADEFRGIDLGDNRMNKGSVRAPEAAAGPQPLWVGIGRIIDFATAWLAFSPDTWASCG